jgi:hypothetical protein
MLSINGTPSDSMDLDGPVQEEAFGRRSSSPTGTYNYEILSMNLSGTSPFGPVMVRDSPSKASLGGTSILLIGGELFHIDNFFDVLTERSVDGGQTWIPSMNSSHVHLVPEPSSVVLVGQGLVAFGLTMLRRRRVKAAMA